MSTTQQQQVKLTSRIQLSGQHFLFDQAGKKVGEAWRFQGKGNFGLRLHGVYWSKGQPNRSGGSGATSCKLLRDCISLAEQTLNSEIPMHRSRHVTEVSEPQPA